MEGFADNLGFVPLLPNTKNPLLGDDVPQNLIGAEIVRFGAVAKHIEGGLVIEYRPRGSIEIHRVVFGFDERAMWVEDGQPCHYERRCPADVPVEEPLEHTSA